MTAHRPPEAHERILVVGKTGQGKTFHVKERLREWLKRGVRVVALDPLDEYSLAGNPRDLDAPGPLRQRVTASELARHPELLAERRLSLAVVPDARNPRAWARAARLLSTLVLRFGRLVLVLDEVATWTDSSLHPECHKAAAELVTLATTGRHDRVALVLVAQRAAGVPKGARAQASEIVAFRQDEAGDVEALADRFRNRDLAEQVARLPRWEAVTWRADSPPQSKPTPAPAPTLRAITHKEEVA